MKIFLSHSSKDKDIVEKVYGELGHAYCHYDVATFDPTGFLPDQIYNALDESTVFVLFASKEALESEWVSGELRVAFQKWMKASVKDVMVFLFRDGSRASVPDWMQAYVVVEHPSPVHIALRIKSRIFSEERISGRAPPFYRYEDLTRLEQNVVTSTENSPKAIFLSAPDGYGRKRLINELYIRQFPSIPIYKILLPLEDCASEVDLYRTILGTLSLHRVGELSVKLTEFENSSFDTRYRILAKEIDEATRGNQVILIDSKDALLNEIGELVPWLTGLIQALLPASYPNLIFLSVRKPTYIKSSIVREIFSHQLNELQVGHSILLFKWWLNYLDVEKIDFVVEQLHALIQGSPKQIELAARLVTNLEIPNGLIKNKKRIFSDLEKQANELLRGMESDLPSVLVLAFIAECGYVSEVDLFRVLENLDGMSNKKIVHTIDRLRSYGFVIVDDVSLRLPHFLVRSAGNLSDNLTVAPLIKSAWKKFAEIFEEIDGETETSIAMLTDMCLNNLKNGENKINIIGSIVMPSQCYRIAHKYYDDREYRNALNLCKKAYEKRIALTNDGCLAVLRIQGLSAARLNDRIEFGNVIDAFGEYGNNIKARRFKSFLLGFDARLDGRFDKALEQMVLAYGARGDGDVHIARELASLFLAQDDFLRAGDYIKKVKSKAKSNLFILAIELRSELARGQSYIIGRQNEIDDLMEEIIKVERSDQGSFSIAASIEYQLAIGNSGGARQLIAQQERDGHTLRHSMKILSAVVFLADRRFSEAKNILVELKKEDEQQIKNQRHSSRPYIIRYFIEASIGLSLSDGIEQLRKYQHMMPKLIVKKLKKEILNSAAFGSKTLTSDEKKFLES
jgi:hypothetical protein